MIYLDHNATNGALAPEYTGEHRYSLLGKRQHMPGKFESRGGCHKL